MINKKFSGHDSKTGQKKNQDQSSNSNQNSSNNFSKPKFNKFGNSDKPYFKKKEDGDANKKPNYGNNYQKSENKSGAYKGFKTNDLDKRPSFNKSEDKPKSNYYKKDNSQGNYKPKFNSGSNSENKPFKKYGDKPNYKPKSDNYGNSNQGEKRPYNKSGDNSSYKPKFNSDSNSENKPFKKYGDKPNYKPKSNNYGNNSNQEKKRPFQPNNDSFQEFKSQNRPFNRFAKKYKSENERMEEFSQQPKPHAKYEKKNFKPQTTEGYKKFDEQAKPHAKFNKDSNYKGNKPQFGQGNKEDKPKFDQKRPNAFVEKRDKQITQKSGNFQKNKFSKRPDYDAARIEGKSKNEKNDKIRLNKYIANAGICSRREADALIEAGYISVNNVVIKELGYQVNPDDVITYNGKKLKRESNVYILLNKPKDYITTTTDPEDRRTVMELVQNVGNERIYPVGRLDRDTTGLLLMTNDGELAQKLSHPSFEISKIYQVELDKAIKAEDFEKLMEGVQLEDGIAIADDAVILNPEKTLIGVEIHLGRNRIIRRIFEALGYDVVKLDRTMYAGLTKRDLPRGHWRHLTEREVLRLKHFA